MIWAKHFLNVIYSNFDAINVHCLVAKCSRQNAGSVQDLFHTTPSPQLSSSPHERSRYMPMAHGI
jgi:hypothetical protein